MVNLSMFPLRGKRWRNKTTAAQKPASESCVRLNQDNNGGSNDKIVVSQKLQRQQSSSSRVSSRVSLQDQHQQEEVELLYKLKNLEHQAQRSRSQGGLSLTSLFSKSGSARSKHQNKEKEDKILFLTEEDKDDDINIQPEHFSTPTTTAHCSGPWCHGHGQVLSAYDEDHNAESKSSSGLARAASILASIFWGGDDENYDDDSYSCGRKPPVEELTIPFRGTTTQDDDVSSLTSRSAHSLTTFGTGSLTQTELASLLPSFLGSTRSIPSPNPSFTMALCQCFGDMEAWVPHNDRNNKNDAAQSWRNYVEEEHELQDDKMATLQNQPTTIIRKKQPMYGLVMADKLSSLHLLSATPDDKIEIGGNDNKSQMTADTISTTSDSSIGDS